MKTGTKGGKEKCKTKEKTQNADSLERQMEKKYLCKLVQPCSALQQHGQLIQSAQTVSSRVPGRTFHSTARYLDYCS